MSTGFDTSVAEPLQAYWNGKFRNMLFVVIPKSMGFFNENSEFWNPVSYKRFSQNTGIDEVTRKLLFHGRPLIICNLNSPRN